MENKGIYLDYNATTPVDPQVYAAMEPYFQIHFGNPASAGHHWGWAAENAVNTARMQVAKLIGAKPSEVFFTSGATESNNWAVFGLLNKLRSENPLAPLHIITSCVEHSSIMKAFEAAARLINVEVDFLPVNSFGQVEIEVVKKAIKPHTKLMSFIWVNNEVGSINPIEELAKIAKENQIYLHTDGTQSVGKIPVNVTAMGVDMMSFSGHKIYGPKGSGVLYVRSKDPKVQIEPLIHGGGQEKGLRSGTMNVPSIVGLGKASEISFENLELEMARMTEMRNLLWMKLHEAIPGIKLNGHPRDRSPITVNVTLPGIKTETILPRLQMLGVSTGSACSSNGVHTSHVLRGLGLSPEETQCSFRRRLGRWTTPDEINRAVEMIAGAIPAQKAILERANL
jgi:cysteine desulfurase